MTSKVRRLAYCAEGSHFVLLEHAVEIGTGTGPDLIEYPVYLCRDCAEELQQIERDRKQAREKAEMALLASWHADQANSYLRSINAHSARTTRLYWAWLDTLDGKTAQPTAQHAAIEGETHT